MRRTDMKSCQPYQAFCRSCNVFACRPNHTRPSSHGSLCRAHTSFAYQAERNGCNGWPCWPENHMLAVHVCKIRTCFVGLFQSSPAKHMPYNGFEGCLETRTSFGLSCTHNKDPCLPFRWISHRCLVGLKLMCSAGQDLSTAGRRLGMDGKRSILFWHIIRIAEELPEKPKWIFLENVPGIRQLALRQVAGALSDAGYDARWTTLRVSAIGGHHRRERWFCLARLRPSAPVADPTSATGKPDALPELRKSPDVGVQQGVQPVACGPAYQTGFWLCEPRVDRMANGVSPKVDRCRLRRNHMLGNAVCPPQALFAFRVLAGLGPYPAKSSASKTRNLSGPLQTPEEVPIDE